MHNDWSRLLAIGVALLAVYGPETQGLERSDGTRTDFTAVLQSVTQLTLMSSTNSVVITDKATIKVFTAELAALEPKRPCLCEHADSVEFSSPLNNVHASICDHCFDIVLTDGYGKSGQRQYYKMPANFYGLFIKKMGNKHYLVTKNAANKTGVR